MAQDCDCYDGDDDFYLHAHLCCPVVAIYDTGKVLDDLCHYHLDEASSRVPCHAGPGKMSRIKFKPLTYLKALQLPG